MSEIVTHPRLPDFWRHEPPKPAPCVVCGDETEWIEMDLAHMHPSCDMYPSPEGDVLIVRGMKELRSVEEGLCANGSGRGPRNDFVPLLSHDTKERF